MLQAVRLLEPFSPKMVQGIEGIDTTPIAEIYGYESEDGQTEDISARTGCIQCPLVTNPKGDHPRQDNMIKRVIAIPKYRYLAPLERLLDVYVEMNKPQNRLVREIVDKAGTSRYPKGPFTREARLWGLSQVKAIQGEINTEARAQGMPAISLISVEEEQRILELIEANTWPQGWRGTEPLASAFQEPQKELDHIQLQWESELLSS